VGVAVVAGHSSVQVPVDTQIVYLPVIDELTVSLPGRRRAGTPIRTIAGVGKLLRRMADSDELLAEWDRSDLASVETAEREYRRWLDRRYVAVRSDDGAHYEPLSGDRLPVDAAEVILTTAMGGG
jgi:hypothetical protein